MGVQRIDERAEIRLGADFWIEPVVVDDVVAMRRAGARLHDRRRVEMADAECGEVRHQGSGVAECELAMELEAVSSADRREAVGVFAHQAAARRRASSISCATSPNAPLASIS